MRWYRQEETRTRSKPHTDLIVNLRSNKPSSESESDSRFCSVEGIRTFSTGLQPWGEAVRTLWLAVRGTSRAVWVSVTPEQQVCWFCWRWERVWGRLIEVLNHETGTESWSSGAFKPQTETHWTIYNSIYKVLVLSKFWFSWSLCMKHRKIKDEKWILRPRKQPANVY